MATSTASAGIQPLRRRATAPLEPRLALDERHEGADQNPVGGSVEHHCRRAPRLGPEQIRHHARNRGEHDHCESRTPRAEHPKRDDRQWPQQVELLLQRQAPGMPEVPQAGAARVGVKHMAVIPEVSPGRQQIRPGDVQRAHSGEYRDRADVEVERGEDADRPPGVEAPQVDPARPLVLAPQQARDEVPADDEEDGYAQVPVAQEEQRGVGRRVLPRKRRPEVRDQHKPDRDGAQAVEAWDAAGGRGGHEVESEGVQRPARIAAA